MKQTRKHSLIETLTNIGIGYGVAVGSQIAIFPMFGVSLPVSDNMLIGVWFTLVSLVRSYALRRWFTGRKI